MIRFYLVYLKWNYIEKLEELSSKTTFDKEQIGKVAYISG